MAEPSDVMLFITFSDQGEAAAAFDEAKELPGARQAAVLTRSTEGMLDTPGSWVKGAGGPTVATGLVGGLLGLFGGPIGVLLGWTAGTFIGGAAELKHFHESAEGLLVYSKDLAEGSALLIVEVREHDPAVADLLAARHGGRLLRRPAEEVEAEVRAAERAAERASDRGGASGF
ncbi:histidine kinase [Kitasatospora sp. RB6PN24]|uniref:histidine kinase n=1 Tax=Kitasatospora humi TaxID=2893891 RepID=UPI001E37F4E2|nr:histidine kinase [Kitasatospora humi]MCC9310637.1 histidine kinase [Kitasatospora humi]